VADDETPDPLTRSLFLRADAELGRLSLAEAEYAARELSKEHPDLKGLRMRAAALRARRGNRLKALREARVIQRGSKLGVAPHRPATEHVQVRPSGRRGLDGVRGLSVCFERLLKMLPSERRRR
jgi:hypothetical protein